MDTLRLTSDLLWRSAWITALIDAPLVLLIARFVSPDLFRRLKWYLAGAAFVFYAALWAYVASVTYWDTVYQLVFPSWSRWLLPLWAGLLNGAVALLFWWLGRLAGRWQAVWFVLLGGLWSIVGHTVGISRGLMSVPMLASVSIASALVFGVFEFIFYWCAITGLGAAASLFRGGRGST